MTDTGRIDDAELDARLLDYGTRWRAAADDADAVDALDLPSADAPAPARRRRLPDAALATIAAAAAAVILVGVIVAIGMNHDDATPAPVVHPTPTPARTVGPDVTGPTLADKDSDEAVRTPQKLALGYSNGMPAMEHVTWSAWDDQHAVGRGTAVEVPCLDECMVKVTTPATLTLDRVSHGRFTRAVFTADHGHGLGTGGQTSLTYTYDPGPDLWSLTALTPGPLLAVYTDGGDTLIRPTDLAFGGSAGAPFMTKLDWSSWGPDTAVGIGTYDQSQCRVSCAAGPNTHTRVRLTLSNLKDGRFTRASFVSLGPEPLMHGSFTMDWSQNGNDYGTWEPID